MSKPYGLLADLHLHPWTSFSSSDERGVNSRLSALLGEIRRAAAVVHEHGGNTLVFAGDVFHVRGSVSPTVLNATIETLARCSSEFGTQFVIIPGNHDLEGRETTQLGSAVTALACKHVVVMNGVHLSAATNVMYLPWFEKASDIKAQLENVPDAFRATIDVIMHAPIDGVIPGLPLHGLDPEYLAALGYKRIFAGHYHNHKAFVGGIHSIGALAHHTWSDVGSKAGFLLVTPDDVKWQKSHLPEFVDLTRLVDVDPEDIPLLVDQNYVRVRVENTKSKEIEEVRQSLLDMGARAVLVQAEPAPAPTTIRAGGVEIKAGATLESSVSDFVKGMAALRDQSAVAAEALSVLGAVLTLGA
jgi:DNA repair exonuclease SbcCD nuclease subunit